MRHDMVTIVGRPNVGKSTLFNRIAKKRASITEDTPGVTRDRLYARAEWLGKPFLLVDTGGLDPKSDDDFMPDILEQAETAIAGSNAVILVVDGKEGISPLDRSILSILRKMNTNIVVAVNKMESKAVQDQLYEFYAFGLEHVIPISAEHGQGIGDLLDAVFSYFPERIAYDEGSREIEVAFVGKPNVGKSSMLNYILGEKRAIVTDIPGTTRDSIDTFIERNGRHFRLIDTAGLRRKAKISDRIEHYSVLRTLSAIEESQVCVVFLDATEEVSEQDTKILGHAVEANKALVIAVNKWDAIEKDTHTQQRYITSIRTKLAFTSYAPIVFVSAKTGQRVDVLMETIVRVHENYFRRIPTGALNEVIGDAVLMNTTPQDKGRRLKIYYAAQVQTAPPLVRISVNDRELTHFSYTRYLENAIRKSFEFEGSPILIDYSNRGQ